MLVLMFVSGFFIGAVMSFIVVFEYYKNRVDDKL